MFLLKKWLPLAEFSGSNSRYDHHQKSMYFQCNANFYHFEPDYLQCLSYGGAWHKASKAFVKKYAYLSRDFLVFW